MIFPKRVLVVANLSVPKIKAYSFPWDLLSENYFLFLSSNWCGPRKFLKLYLQQTQEIVNAWGWTSGQVHTKKLQIEVTNTFVLKVI